MLIKVTKMQGCGNDFLLIDATEGVQTPLSTEKIKWLCDRHFGIGCDQLLLLRGSKNDGYTYTIYNGDGSEAEQCGNGVRCVAKYLRDQNLWATEHISLACRAGLMDVEFMGDDTYRVNMGAERSIEIMGELTFVSMGNPHVIKIVQNLDINIEQESKIIKDVLKFPGDINVSFMKIYSPEHVALRVFERGAGETLACGSAACAAVVAGQALHQLADIVKVDLPGGQLLIEKRAGTVFMTGPAATIFITLIDI